MEEGGVAGLWKEVRELSLGNDVERLESPPSPLQFLRQFVSPNRPCIISNATLHWPALSSWAEDGGGDEEYLSRALGRDCKVSVHLTPDGRADAIVPLASSSPPLSVSTPDEDEDGYSSSLLCFASAHVERMPFSLALQHIANSGSPSSSSFVAYAQEQNDCFRSEYSALASDVESHIPWASEALGCLPEAVNLWIGNHRSETSFHKDHYENLYAVISGEKHFLLLPPTDVHRMYIGQYPAARYSFNQETGEFSLKLEKPLRYVPWCSVDPYPSSSSIEQRQRSMFPRYFSGPKPFECTVKAGEILYLNFHGNPSTPSPTSIKMIQKKVNEDGPMIFLMPERRGPNMWFHHVRQSPDSRGRTIAINYWYDMQFDIKYAYFNFLQSIDYHLAKPSAKVSEYHEESLDDDRTAISDVIHDCPHATEPKLGNIVQYG